MDSELDKFRNKIRPQNNSLFLPESGVGHERALGLFLLFLVGLIVLLVVLVDPLVSLLPETLDLQNVGRLQQSGTRRKK